MAKVVYNARFGGLYLSEKALARLRELGVDVKCSHVSEDKLPRHDKRLVQVVEELGKAANGNCAELKIEEIPDGALYRIDKYDGSETVETPSSYEWKVAE